MQSSWNPFTNFANVLILKLILSDFFKIEFSCAFATVETMIVPFLISDWKSNGGGRRIGHLFGSFEHHEVFVDMDGGHMIYRLFCF